MTICKLSVLRELDKEVQSVFIAVKMQVTLTYIYTVCFYCAVSWKQLHCEKSFALSVFHSINSKLSYKVKQYWDSFSKALSLFLCAFSVTETIH